jgi:hypothetical protein
MKRNICRLGFSLVLLMCLVVPASAQTDNLAFFEWELSADGSEVYITKYSGSETNVVVPERIQGKPVTGLSGFANNTTLVSVQIPQTVTKINLQKNSLYLGAFTHCTSLKSIVLPAKLTDIAAYSFAGCTALESVTTGSDIVYIGSHAFSDCTAITSFTIPPRVTKISWATFTRCTALETVTVPEGVTEIAYMSFAGCTALRKIIFPQSLRHVGPQTFENCSALEEIVVQGEDIKFHDYGSGIFTGCTAATEQSRRGIRAIGYRGSFD